MKIVEKLILPIGEHKKPKDRVKLGISPSTVVEEWDCKSKGYVVKGVPDHKAKD